MSVSNRALLSYLDGLLQPHKVKDYCPNGLQVEGNSTINKLVTGVTATQELIDAAIELQADAVFVHHGYFWKGEDPCITGMKRKRIAALLQHNINLFAYHLPLDVHPELGNNVQLAKRLAIQVGGGLDAQSSTSIALKGQFAEPLTAEQLQARLQQSLQRQPLMISGGDHLIRTVAWCTGGGQGYIDMAAEQGIDAFISGEASEQTVHTAREMQVHFFAAGHHATERYGAKAVGEHLTEKFALDVTFVDKDNPV